MVIFLSSAGVTKNTEGDMQGRAGRIPVSRLITKYFEYREDNGEYLVWYVMMRMHLPSP